MAEAGEQDIRPATQAHQGYARLGTSLGDGIGHGAAQPGLHHGGWNNEPFGVSWQIVPKRFMELIGDKAPKKVQAVVTAMMKRVKLDVAALEKAYHSA